MDTSKLKKFAQFARRTLREQVSAKLALVLSPNSAARRESPQAVKKLEEAIAQSDGQDPVIERVAYTWFNRFCALRFMDVNRYTRIGVVSPAEGQFQPEILLEAKMGHFDEDMVPLKARQKVADLLAGRAPSHDGQGEAYRLLVVAACNAWHQAMPFLFQRIDDYTELLMPDDLLSGNSILAYTREAMTPDACEDVEVIGWLYQFYISEKKDEVFDGLKKNKKITPENIPAATQLFTPHWIVRYLVENSLGRLWLLNRPGSKLVEQMDYYIKPEQAETDFLRIAKPEEIKICDPACGSGHMLTYAFDLLYAIYEEEGVDPAEIPEKILTNNLYGIEIDERAGELAAFALTMKARAKQRRFFNKGVKPNICVLENVHFDGNELKDYMDFVGRDLFTAPLQTTLRQFEEADNFGSLIRPDVTDVDGMLRILESKNVSGQLFISMTHQKVLQALRQADYLSPKYHVVIANPPYMGGGGMNGRLGVWLKDNYADVKTDLFSAFIVRNTEMTLPKGQLGFMSPFVWMFISSYEKLRSFLINQKTITSLVQLEYSGFDGATVPVCTFTIENTSRPLFKGGFVRLSDFRGSENQGPKTLEAIKNKDCGWFFRASAENFKAIPGSPIAYWVSENFVNPFKIASETIYDLTISDGQTKTGDNDKYLRQHWEVASSTVGPKAKWWQHPKGGPYRKWFGNVDWVIDWSETARKHYRKDRVARILPEYLWGKRGISWTLITSGESSFRTLEANQIFNLAAPSLFFHDESNIEKCLGFLNTKYVTKLLKVINPTLNMNVGEVRCLPLLDSISPQIEEITRTVRHCVAVSKADWDSFETSWDFTSLPLLNPDYRQSNLKATYQKLRAHWREMTLEMQRLEQENNRIFIEAYGLKDELDQKVDLSEITLTCNPHYRYGNDKSGDELEALLLADTMRELVSYAVGCMFGRYALDRPGLILANQGETIEDYLKRVPEPSFAADDDNVIPMLDGDWFTDDITLRVRQFLRVAFGDAHYEDNLAFIEQALNIKGKRNYGLRDYLLGEFYADHVKRYKKRPIYWLFSSPKGSFNALIYMHRYRPDTVSVVLRYLRDYREKLATEKERQATISINPASSQGDKTRALKETDRLAKVLAELEDYERDVLYPLATHQVQIDLDDGVKVNYLKFEGALKKIPGLAAKDED